MGLFTNPLGYAGYPPGVTAPATVVNSTVRAATAAEAAAGTLSNVYISPATESSSVALDFANPPALGFGSTTPAPVHATTLSTAGAITLADGNNIAVGTTTGTKIGTATTQKLGFWNVTPVVQPAAATDILVALIATGILASGASPLNLGSAALGSGTHTLSDGANIVVGTTTGTKIGTATTQKIGFYNVTPIVLPAAATDILVSLIALGLIASGASPLNLGAAALTCGTMTSEKVVSTAVSTDVAGTFTAASATVSAVVCAVGSIQVPATIVAGATPVTNSVRTGQASFTTTIAGTTGGALVMTNSLISSGSIIISSVSCTTAGSQVAILSTVPGSGTVTFNCYNFGGTTTAANININFWILN